jgi:methionyl-tRNA synthetase
MAAMQPVPKQVWAHGWFLMDAAKMSKSKGNVVLPRPIANMLGMDALRYFLLREVVFGQDGNFSYDALVTRYNSDLANGLGNLASRVLTMIQSYFEGKIPATPDAGGASSTLGSSVRAVKGLLTEGAWNEAGQPTAVGHYDALKFSAALQEIWQLISMVDNYLTQQKPWELAKDPTKKGRLAEVLYESAEALRAISILAHPILPNATQTLWENLGMPGDVGTQRIDELAWGGLRGGEHVKPATPLFPRVDHREAIERIEAMANEELNPAPAAPLAKPAASTTSTGAAAAPQAAPEKIGIEDFAKVEMRVGQIKTAERIVGADKLLKLTVDIGTEIRQICAGIAQYYEPEKLVGRKVAVVVNLAPRKLRGVESNGMIIAASVGPEGRPVLAGFPDEDVEVGARLK